MCKKSLFPDTAEGFKKLLCPEGETKKILKTMNKMTDFYVMNKLHLHRNVIQCTRTLISTENIIISTECFFGYA